jgi:Flp pilus assembly protein CpaB
MHIHRARNIRIALALAVGATVLVTLYLARSKSDGSPAVGAQLARVLVATRDIAVGTPGSELGGTLRPKEVSPDAVVPGAISSAAEVRRLVASQQIYAGEQVTARRFQPVQAEGVPGQIKGTMRALKVPGADEQLLVGTLEAGSRVDVVANLRYRKADVREGAADQDAQQEQVVTRTVLRDLRVLEAPQTAAMPGTQQASVLLAVTDAQARKLFFVMKNADWTLELRPAHGAADGPEAVETMGSVVRAGLGGAQAGQLASGSRSHR